MKALIALLLLAFSCVAAASDSLQVEDPWIRAAPPGARMLAGYALLENQGASPLSLVAARSERFGLVEIHRTVEIDGVARMRQVESVEIPGNGRAALQPGGLHLMLMRPKAEVSEGERIEIRLEFSDGSQQAIEFEVRRLARATAASSE